MQDDDRNAARRSAAKVSGSHLPALDGLRGLAALLVVLAHLPKAGLASSPPPLSGPLGVMLFFILSGFLMGHLYLSKPFDRAACVRYIAARIARVLPLYYLVVIGSFALTILLGNDFAFHVNASQLARLLLIVSHDYVFWSIPPEIQFYFVFLLLWGLTHHRAITSWLPAVGFFVAVIFLLRPLLPGISALGQLQIFLTGVGVALARRRFGTRITPAAALAVQLASLVAGVLIVTGVVPVHAIMQGVGRSKDDIAYANLPLALAVGSALLAFTIDTRFARAVFANPVAERLGAFSFGIYLLHWPIMHAVHTSVATAALPPLAIGLLGLAVTITAAASAHYGFERPMQRLLRPRLASLLDRVFAARPDAGVFRSADRI